MLKTIFLIMTIFSVDSYAQLRNLNNGDVISSEDLIHNMNELKNGNEKYGISSPLNLSGNIIANDLNNWFNFARNIGGINQFNSGEIIEADLLNNNFVKINNELSLVELYSSCNEIKTKWPDTATNGLYNIDYDMDGLPEHVYCDMTNHDGGWSLVMKLSSNQYSYGSSRWRDGVTYNSNLMNDETYPSGYDAEHESFNKMHFSNKIRIQVKRGTNIYDNLLLDFDGFNSPMNLITSNANPILSVPSYLDWKAAFGHDRSGDPVFERAGVRSRALKGCGQPMMLGYQAHDGPNDVNSGLGQNGAYCGGETGNLSVGGNWSSNNAQVLIWEKSTIIDSSSLPRNCKEILENDPSKLNQDGYYLVDFDKEAIEFKPIEVYCDMTRDDGGWTLVANVSSSNKNHYGNTGGINNYTKTKPITNDNSGRTMTDAQVISVLNSTNGNFRIDVGTVNSVNFSTYFKLNNNNLFSFNRRGNDGSGYKIFTSHVYPFVWEEDGGGDGYELYDNRYYVFDNHGKNSNEWTSSEYNGKRVLWGYTGSANNGIYPNLSGQMWIK